MIKNSEDLSLAIIFIFNSHKNDFILSPAMLELSNNKFNIKNIDFRIEQDGYNLKFL